MANWNIILCERSIIIQLTLSCEECVNTPSSPDSGKCVALFGSPCSCVWHNTFATASVDSKTQNTKKISRQTRVHFNAIYEMFAMIFLNACPSLNDSRNGSEILQQSSCFQNRYCIHIRMGARRQWWAISSDVGAQSIANPTKSLHTFIHWANSTSYPYVTANLWRPLIKSHHHKQWT